MRRTIYRSKLLTCGLALSAAGLWAAAPVSGQTGGPAHATPPSALPPDAPGAPRPEKDKDKDKDEKGPKRFADFAEVTKDMEATEGLFTLYRFDKGDKNRDPEKLLAKIPAKLLNEDLLFATTIARGSDFTGYMWTDYLFRFEVAGNLLKMVVPDTRYIADDDKPVAEAIRRTYGDSYVAAVPILSMTPQGDVLVDLGPLLKSNIADVAFLGGQVRPELSKWAKVKSFPENMLIEADLALGQGQGGKNVGVAYAFQKLPKLGSYKPREADPRIGYFGTTRIDFARPSSEREVAVRYINRWNLEKRDPSLELSPPKKPIVFVIEKTVPIQWRRWVRDGILDWNPAFEKIGYVDAIVVQQQTDDNEYKDWDPEDSRYNFIRWTVRGIGLAVGPSRADPRTGQIVDADIVIDEGWVRYFVNNIDIFGVVGPKALADDPGLAKLYRDFPDFVPTQFHPTGAEPLGMFEQWRLGQRDLPCPLHQDRFHACTFASGLKEQINLAYLAMVATGSGKKIPERLIGEALKEVVTHEVGHTLGLRHNFKASAWLTLEEIKKRRDGGDEATTASVMDYNPLLYFAEDDLEKVRHFATPVIGPYDFLAIEYGYRSPGKGDKNEGDMLKEVAGRANQPGNWYATDEDTVGVYSPDPLSNRYDMGDDPVAWARTRSDLCRKLIGNVREWAVKDGEPKFYLTQAVSVLLGNDARNYGYVARLIGGQLFNRDNKGDPNGRPAFVLIDGATQRNALKVLNESLFCDSFGKLNPELLNELAPERWGDFAGDAPLRLDFPIHERILGLQLMSLMQIMAPPVLQRVYDAELKTEDAKKFTAAELIRSTRDGIWAQLDKTGGSYSDAQPMISSTARNLQKQYLNMMLSMAQMPPGSGMSADLNGMVRFALRELSDKMGGVLKGGGDGGKSKLDFATRAHLSECKSRIDRVLDAQFTAR